MAFNRQIILREDPIPARFAASTATIKKQSIIEEKTFFIGWSLSDDMRYLMDLTLIDRTFYVLIRKQAVKAANGGIPDTFRTWLNIGRSRGCPASLSTSPGYRRKREREREREREIQSTRSARALLPMRFLAPRLPRGPVEMSHNRAPPRNRKFTPLRNKWANSTSTLSLSLSLSLGLGYHESAAGISIVGCRTSGAHFHYLGRTSAFVICGEITAGALTVGGAAGKRSRQTDGREGSKFNSL